MRTSIVTLLWVAIAALVVWAAPVIAQEEPEKTEPDCALCVGEHEIACPTCEGDGRAKAPCATCNGKGRTVCVDSSTGGSGRSMFAGLAPRRVHSKRSVSCPNSVCRDGKVRWDDGKQYGCKLCGKRGKVKCRRCELGARHTCADCKGSKKAESECVDCAGSGKLACHLCAPDEGCRTCPGTSTVACPRCRLAKKAAQTCTRCAGGEKGPCTHCSGVGKRMCDRCAATGKQRARYEDGSTAVSKKCGACKGKGARDCMACERGIGACSNCNGTGTDHTSCRFCRWQGEVGCPSCGPRGFRTSELCAGVLVKMKNYEAARTLYADAATRVQAELDKTTADLERAGKSTLKRPTRPRNPTPAQSERYTKELLAYLAALLEEGGGFTEQLEARKKELSAELRRIEKARGAIARK